jgi:hypothetical protein
VFVVRIGGANLISKSSAPARTCGIVIGVPKFESMEWSIASEQEVALDGRPAPVREYIQKKAAGRTIKKVESMTKGCSVTYEATMQRKAYGIMRSPSTLTGLLTAIELRAQVKNK